MFNKIDYYIFRTIFSSFLIVTFIFAVLFFIFTYVAVVSNNTGFDALILTIQQLPGIMYTLMPAASMIGSLMGLSLLANNSEIIVLRAAGLSTIRIARGAIYSAIVISLIAIFLGGYISPKVLSFLGDKFEVTKLTYSENTNKKDLWLKTNLGYSFIRSIDPVEKRAKDIRKIIVDDNKLQEIRFARRAVYKGNRDADVYQIKNIKFPNKPKAHHVQITSADKDQWDDPLPISVAKVITQSQDFLNIKQLFSYITTKTKASDEAISLHFWQEIFQPISLFVLTLISVPLCVGSVRSSSFIIRLLLGVLIGFLFFVITQITGPVTLILHLPPILGAAGPTILSLLFLIYLFLRMKEN